MINKINNIILWFLIIFATYCAFFIGLTWDTFFHIDIGSNRLRYLLSLGTYDYTPYADQKFYPGFFDTLTVFITKMFPKKYEIETIHLTRLIFSISTIFGISKIASELFNKQVGKIVFILCFFNPTFFGHMAINQKDIIIAFSNIWATYLIIKYLKNQSLNEKRNSYLVLLGLVIGLGLGVRIAFFGTLIPVVLISIIEIFFLKQFISRDFSNRKLVIDIIKVIIISYFLMILCWPETHENIFILPFKLFIESFEDIRGVSGGLSAGNFYLSSETPKLYLLTNLFYKLPEFILLTYFIFIYLIFKKKVFFEKNFKSFSIKLILIFSILIFPHILLFISPYKIIDGLRLFLYMMPYICIIPALVIYYLIFNFKMYTSKIFLTSIFIFFTYYLLIFFSLTPYQYTYLNIFNGDFSKSHQKFENDYWAVSINELVNQIPNNKDLLNNSELKLAFCGASDDNVKFYLKNIKNFKFQQVNWINEDYDYIFMTNRVILTDLDSNMTSKEKINTLETCFDRFKGSDVITVKRNSLILSTLRKKN